MTAAVVVVAPDVHQQAALDAALVRHENIFITGPAGSGKSFTLRVLVRGARARRLKVAVCSSTGRSAVELALSATTLHSLLALGDTGERSVASYVRQLEAKRHDATRQRIAGLDLLVIDEVSMLSARLLGLAEAIIASVRRRTSEPWGGVQVVYSGDFAQLRPVASSRGKRKASEPAPTPQLAFHAVRAWVEANVLVYNLGELHRQATDLSYAALLNRARFARVTPADVAALQARIITSPEQRAALAATSIFLFARNADADACNASRLATFSTEGSRTYRARIDVKVRPSAKRAPSVIEAAASASLLDSMRALPAIELRLGARVLLLANVNVADGLANGSTGVVVGFDEDGPAPTQLPYVEFDGRPGRVLVKQHTWTQDGELEYRATYVQLPLMLAWATSIHRAQGLTLRSVVADLSASACFAPGMAYVVLSRVPSLESIHFLAFSSSAIYADPEVRSFYWVGLAAPV